MINKILFFIKLIFIRGISKLKVLYMQIVYHGVSLPPGIIIPRDVVIATSGGGTISIGGNVTLCRDAQLISQGGKIRLDDNVHIGVGVIIVSLASIQIGKDTLISEYVIIGAHSFVRGAIPSNALAVGVPAIVNKSLMPAWRTSALHDFQDRIRPINPVPRIFSPEDMPSLPIAAIDSNNDPSIGVFKKDSNLVERFFNKLKQFRCVASRHTSTYPVL
jgi:acetyltransferase-like isoleucine patch superfamily enzyme